ncbi:hypothetical protein D3C78_1334520 [compost metagenome]
MKGHQILQIVFTNLRAGKLHLAKAITLPAVEVDVPIGLVQLFGHAELALGQIGIEVAFAQCQAGQRTFKTVVFAVIEDLAYRRLAFFD